MSKLRDAAANMPKRIVFILSTGRTGTRTLAEGLNGGDILSRHQPPFSRLLTIASNYYLHGWLPGPDLGASDNAFKAQWELFLRHVVDNEPFRWSLLEGAKGVQLAELGLKSWRERRWIEVPELKE